MIFLGSSSMSHLGHIDTLLPICLHCWPPCFHWCLYLHLSIYIDAVYHHFHHMMHPVHCSPAHIDALSHLYPHWHISPLFACSSDCSRGGCPTGQDRGDCDGGRRRYNEQCYHEDVRGAATCCPCPHRGWSHQGKAPILPSTSIRWLIVWYCRNIHTYGVHWKYCMLNPPNYSL